MPASPTVLFIKADSYNEYDSETIAGLGDAVREAGGQLLVFSGQTLYGSVDSDPGIRALYGFIRAAKPDGIVVNAWLPDIRPPNSARFLSIFNDIPVFFMGEGWEDRPYCHLHGAEYMRQLLAHLHEVHGRTRIAFVAPVFPDDRDEAWRRYMGEIGCLDERLYVSSAQTMSDSVPLRAEKAVQYLFDRSDSVRPDAIVSMNTDECVAILSSLKRRGVEIPRQLSLASWEDGEVGRFCDPPLSCVEYPYRQMGYASGEALCRMLKGENVPRETRVPTKLILRASCGCSLIDRSLAAAEEAGHILSGGNDSMRETEHFKELLGANTDTRESAFLSAWALFIEKHCSVEKAPVLRQIIHDLRDYLHRGCLDRDDTVFDVLQKAQLLLDEVERHQLLRESARAINNQQRMNHVSMALIQSRDSLSTLGSLDYVVGDLGLEGCWVSIFRDDTQSPLSRKGDTGTSLLELSTVEDLSSAPVELLFRSDNGSRRPECEGVPDVLSNVMASILQPARVGRQLLGKILNIGDSFEGFLLVDMGEYDIRILEGLSRVLASSLNAAWTMERLLVARNELRILAEEDSLTGLGNRYAFNRDIQLLCNEPPPSNGMQTALLFMDLDGFKPVNDSYGHDAGDELLKIVAHRLESICGSRSRGIYRVGGDEFTVLLESSGPQDSVKLAKKIIAGIKQTVIYRDVALNVGVSIGCAHYPRDSRDSGSLVKYADISLYRAKERRGSVVVFDRSKDAPRLRQIELRRDIQTALDRGEIEVAWQGLFENSGGLAGIEALIRWRHPDFGMLLPDDFLDVASEANMIVPIERFILERSCEHIALIRDNDPGSKPFVMVNCSQAFFFNPDFISLVKTAIRERGLSRESLCLGLEEKAAFNDIDRTLSVISSLKSLGVRFVLVGTGRPDSWLGFLNRLPSGSIVKVDRSYVAAIAGEEEHRSFLFRLFDLLETRGLGVAVSGVETATQQEFLLRPGLLVQGFALDERND